MSDFAHDKSRQMAREFKIGISLLAVLFCVFVAVAYRHYSKSFVDPPSEYAARWSPPADSEKAPGDSPMPVGPEPAPHRIVEIPAMPAAYDEASYDVSQTRPADQALLPVDSATFEQDSSSRQLVQPTQYQGGTDAEAGFELELPDLRPRALASAPQAFRIEGPSKPIDPSPSVESVRADDSFWLISQRVYGSGDFFRALYEHNREQFPEPDQLAVGTSVKTPSLEYLKQNYVRFFPPTATEGAVRSGASEARTARDYTVVGGESLFDIARFQLGQASRYVEIFQLNRDVLGDRVENLPAGLRLRLP